MSKKTIYFKSANSLINQLKKRDDIQVLKDQGFISSLFKKKVYPDIYFHSNTLDEKAIDYILNSKFTITNSFSSMNQIIAKTKISHEKIKVIYPSVDMEYKKPKELKQSYLEEFGIQENTKLLFFTAKNFKTSGIKEFLDIASSLSYPDFKAIIAGSKQQMNVLNFILTKYPKLEDKLILLEDYKKLDDIFLISDVFILPTYNKLFASTIIKAMFSKCLVFVSLENDAKEIVDVYASMDSPTDPSTGFKVDAVLYDENELKKIKKENRKIGKEASLEANLEKIEAILTNI